jgi:tetratricopeptide (TPR) repeat protein
VAPGLGVVWNNAPPPLEEWVGRADLLAAIDRDWADPQRRVTGLIGFGGEGKSSLARRWVEDLLAAPGGAPASAGPQSGGGDADCGPHRAVMGGGDADCGPRRATEGQGDADGGVRQAVVRPDGVFWWGFYTRPSVDEFFEAALDYLSGGRVDPRQYPSASAKAHFIAAMLYTGRYLFVLDGLEVMQRQEGDRYGLLRSADLRDFLRYLAAPGHESFGLVTSRAPLLDLMAYTSYMHRDVGRLFPGDGRALLRRAGVRGPAAALDKVVADWDGHALTLSLIGAHLVSQYGGEVARAGEIDPPTAGEPRYERVHRVLRRYDEHLGQAERAFLTLFSAFRTAVPAPALEKVFRAGGGEATLPVERKPGFGQRAGAEKPGFHAIAALEDAAFAAMVQRLVGYRILRHDEREGMYTTHPLVRNHYYARLIEGGEARARAAHERIQEYYLELAGDTPRAPTLDDLVPLIEVVHHACCAGAYDEADQVHWDRIQQRQRGVLVYQLGAWETDLALLSEFFPGGDTSREPQVSDRGARRWILNETGLCLMNLGRLGEAAPFYERKNAIALQREDWHNASIGYRNLAELHAHLGALEASAQAAEEALALARRAGNKRDEMISLACQAWAAHLRGDLAAAGAAFRGAEALGREIEPDVRYLYSLRGIRHADHLRRAGDAAYARRVAEANLAIGEQYRWVKSISQCHRVMGDLEADAGRHEDAGAHYGRALEIARGITFRPALIEALLARGRWAARHLQDPAAAFGDLEEALGYAVEGGYRVYEADARAARAWAHLAAGDAVAARAEAARARQMSEEMGYGWGRGSET